MIQANELRIGNLVINHLNEIHKIKPNNILAQYQFDVAGEEGYKPIPITEEWILKFDVYEIMDKTWRFHNYVIEHWHNMYVIKYISMTNELIQIGTEIKYVHQFQNIAFALTQKELTCK